MRPPKPPSPRGVSPDVRFSGRGYHPWKSKGGMGSSPGVCSNKPDMEKVVADLYYASMALIACCAIVPNGASISVDQAA